MEKKIEEGNYITIISYNERTQVTQYLGSVKAEDMADLKAYIRDGVE